MENLELEQQKEAFKKKAQKLERDSNMLATRALDQTAGTDKEITNLKSTVQRLQKELSETKTELAEAEEAMFMPHE